MGGEETHVQDTREVIFSEIVGGLLNTGLKAREFGFTVGLVLQAGGEGAHFFLFDVLALSENTFEFKQESGHFLVHSSRPTAEPWA